MDRVPRGEQKTAEDVERLQSATRQGSSTSMYLTPSDVKLTKRLADELGVSRSKVVGLAVRRYAVEMGVAELDDTPACSSNG